MQYRRARRKFDDDPENHERWLISYADFITLLFAFFVVMYAVSSVNIGKYRVFSDSLGTAFGGAGSAAPTNTEIQSMPLPTPAQRKRLEQMRKEKEQMARLARELGSSLSPLIKEGKVRVVQNAKGVSVEINSSVLFNPGDARLTLDARTTLTLVANLLKEDTHAVEVEGHTDSSPINNAAFASNWELSAVRAGTVVRLFIEAGMAPSRMTAVGRASNQPIASNLDAESRARNRRVAITILSGT